MTIVLIKLFIEFNGSQKRILKFLKIQVKLKFLMLSITLLIINIPSQLNELLNKNYLLISDIDGVF